MGDQEGVHHEKSHEINKTVLDLEKAATMHKIFLLPALNAKL